MLFIEGPKAFGALNQNFQGFACIIRERNPSLSGRGFSPIPLNAQDAPIKIDIAQAQCAHFFVPHAGFKDELDYWLNNGWPLACGFQQFSELMRSQCAAPVAVLMELAKIRSDPPPHLVFPQNPANHAGFKIYRCG